MAGQEKIESDGDDGLGHGEKALGHEDNARSSARMLCVNGCSSVLLALIRDDRTATVCRCNVEEYFIPESPMKTCRYPVMTTTSSTTGQASLFPSMPVHPAAAAYFLRAVSGVVSNATQGWVSWTKVLRLQSEEMPSVRMPCPFRSISNEIHGGITRRHPWRDALTSAKTMFRVTRCDGTNVAVHMAALVLVDGAAPSLVSLGNILMSTDLLVDSSLCFPSRIKEPTFLSRANLRDGEHLNTAVVGGTRGHPASHHGAEATEHSGYPNLGDALRSHYSNVSTSYSPTALTEPPSTSSSEIGGSSGESVNIAPLEPASYDAQTTGAVAGSMETADTGVAQVHGVGSFALLDDGGQSRVEDEAGPGELADIAAVEVTPDAGGVEDADVTPATRSINLASEFRDPDTPDCEAEKPVNSLAELTQVVAEVDAYANDVQDKFASLDALQSRISSIDPNTIGCEVALKLHSEAQNHLDDLHRRRAQEHRSACNVNRLYDTHLCPSKQELVRELNIRAAHNAESFTRMLATVNAFMVPADALEGSDLEHFSCDVSRVCVDEALEEGDVMGFGVALGVRSESSLQDPTLLSVERLSATVLSKTTFEDAVKFGFGSKGAQITLGGFNGSGVVLLGRGREAINAWLPLYICPTHFTLVKVMLPQILGFFFTLDPLGYHPTQLPALYNILAHLLVLVQRPLGASPCSTDVPLRSRGREEMLVGEFLRVCSALLPEAREILGYNPVQRFLAGPTLKDRPNPMLVVGWAVAELGALPLHPANRDRDDKASLREQQVADSLRLPLWMDAVQQFPFRDNYKCPKRRDMVGRILYGKQWLHLGRSGMRDTEGRGEGRPAVNAGVDAAFAEFAAEVFRGRSSTEMPTPEFERLDDERKGVCSFDADYWDDDVAGAVKEMEEKVEASSSMSMLMGAICLPDVEELEKRQRKALLVAGLMRRRVEECGELQILSSAHSWLEQARDAEKWDQQLEKEQQAMLPAWSGSMLSFCGRLMAICPVRAGRVWKTLVRILQREDAAASIPLCQEKIRVLVLGRFTFEEDNMSDTKEKEVMDHPVIAGGSVWGLSAQQVSRFERVLGSETMQSLREEARSRTGPRIRRKHPKASLEAASLEASEAVVIDLHPAVDGAL